jgi:hypothetical protein
LQPIAQEAFEQFRRGLIEQEVMADGAVNNAVGL